MRKKSKQRIDLKGYIELLEGEIRLFESEEIHFHESKRWKECIINREYKHATQRVLDSIMLQSYAKKNTAAKWDIEDIISNEIKYEKNDNVAFHKNHDYEKSVSSVYRLEQFEYLFGSINDYIKK